MAFTARSCFKGDLLESVDFQGRAHVDELKALYEVGKEDLLTRESEFEALKMSIISKIAVKPV